MKRLGLIVFLVCLMSNSVFASYFWMQAHNFVDGNGQPYAPTDNWMEPNQWDLAQTGPPSANPGVPPLDTTQQIKLITHLWMSEIATCTIDSNIGSYTGATTSVNANLYINGNANIGFKRTGSTQGLRVGSQNAGGISTIGDVNQSAGAVTVSNLYLGYGGTMSGAAEGYYVISGGSLTITNDPNSGGVYRGGLSVGSGANQASGGAYLINQTIGKFTVVGPNSTISVTSVVVAGNIVGPGNGNTGTLEFQLSGGAVSPINCSSRVNIDSPNSVANLVVTLLDEEVPPPVIVLVKNSSNNAVVGTFDSVSGDTTPWDRALEGDTVVLTTPGLTSYTYTLTYRYNADGTANDIALIPEPATIALFGLGLLALVRRPRSK